MTKMCCYRKENVLFEGVTDKLQKNLKDRCFVLPYFVQNIGPQRRTKSLEEIFILL